MTFPRPFIARSRKQGYQTRFYECAALSESMYRGMAENGLSDGAQRAFAQWRLDWPLPDRPHVLDDHHQRLISVAEKILSRGGITLCSPLVEESLGTLFLGDKSLDDFQVSLEDIFSQESVAWSKEGSFWLDSPSEEKFYQGIVPTFLGHSYARWIIPQVELSCLLSSPASGQTFGRVDFLVNHPKMQSPLVVEIDGADHRQHTDRDDARDTLLREDGLHVLRIPSAEVDRGEGDQLSVFEDMARPIKQQDEEVGSSPATAPLKLLRALKYVHQFQLVLLQSIRSGFLPLTTPGRWNISSDIHKNGLLTEKEAFRTLDVALRDLVELLRNLGRLYDVEIQEGVPQFSPHPKSTGAAAVHVSFSSTCDASVPCFSVRPVFVPFHLASSAAPAEPMAVKPPAQEVLLYFLKYLFRKPGFWEGQVDAIARVLQGKDTIVLLPTGAGKSLAFQLASLLLPGTAVVIDPIISLMEDQIDNLRTIGIDRCVAITSAMEDPEDRAKALDLFSQSQYLFTYVAPERFQTVEFRESIKALTVHTPVSLIVVDEAHCISEWGHDFRTSYLNIGRTSRAYCGSSGRVSPLIALTGTASRAVLKDVQRELQIQDFEAIITPKSFDRQELHFRVIACNSHEKTATLISYLRDKLPSMFSVTRAAIFQPMGHNTFSGLVFCPNVNGECGVLEKADELAEALGVEPAFYSGSSPKRFRNRGTWVRQKRETAERFKHNKVPLLVCTKAYGMGIDKPNIRYTVHLCLPPSIESFYQEAGRAGRDRRTAFCCILFSDNDPQRTQRLLDRETPVEAIYEVIHGLRWGEKDDIAYALYFQVKAFPGLTEEKTGVLQVVQSLPDLSRRGRAIIKASEKDRQVVEKALHRLLILGVILDYTIDYSAGEFEVDVSGASKEMVIESYGNYVGGYIAGKRQVEVERARSLLAADPSLFLPGMVELVLRFIYEVIEQGRRRALEEMRLVANLQDDQSIRERILRYLESTEFSEALDGMVGDRNAGLMKMKQVYEALRSPNEAGELRGQVSRYLESYPDHPALLILRALSEACCRDRDKAVVDQNFMAAISAARRNYAVANETLFKFITWSLVQVSRKYPEAVVPLQQKLLRECPERALAVMLMKNLPREVQPHLMWFLLGRLTDELSAVLRSEQGERNA